MKSLKIVTVKENKKDFTIYFDNRYSLSVLKETYFKFSLYELEEVNEDFINKIKKEDNLIRCSIIAKRNLASGRKSSARLFHILENKGFESDTIESIITTLKQEERLDDVVFAKKFLQKKIKSNKFSSNMLISLLVNEGIDERLSIELVENKKIDNYKIAKSIVKKRFKDKKSDTEKVYTYLASKGFEKEVIFAVIRKEEQ